MEVHPSAPGGRSATARTRPYAVEERVYADWIHRFVKRLTLRLPDEPQASLLGAAGHWAHQADHLDPEEAAEIASMWWHSYAIKHTRGHS